MKTCSKCRETKQVSEFGLHKLGKNGLRSYCKSCQSIINRAAYIKRTPNAMRRKTKNGDGKTQAERQRLYEKAHPEYLRKKWKRSRDALSGSYIRSLLGIKNAPQELVEIKREQVAILRLTKQLNKSIKEKVNGT